MSFKCSNKVLLLYELTMNEIQSCHKTTVSNRSHLRKKNFSDMWSTFCCQFLCNYTYKWVFLKLPLLICLYVFNQCTFWRRKSERISSFLCLKAWAGLTFTLPAVTWLTWRRGSPSLPQTYRCDPVKNTYT